MWTLSFTVIALLFFTIAGVSESRSPIDVNTHSLVSQDLNKNTQISKFSVLKRGTFDKFQSVIAAADGQVSLEESQAIDVAIKNTVITMSAAVLFGIGTWYFKGKQASIEFFTGFLIEKSLSVDNLFVFLMLFEYFKVPFQYQNRVLTWGLMGAVVMRGFMIAVGVTAVQKFKWVTLLFAGILIFSGYKLMFEGEGEEDLEQNAVLKIASKLVKSTTKFNGEKFFLIENGQKLATPLLMCLISIELSDFAFAVDSIPAILGVSRDPFIVYTSNIFAILGLRSLYVLISRALSKLKYIRPSVAAVLLFVGAKLVAEYFHVEIPALVSLLVIGVLLGAGVTLSLLA